MNLRSMTGWGEGHTHANGPAVDVSIRSVNHKQLDVRVNIASELSALESEVVAALRGALHRGRVEVRVSVTADEQAVQDSWQTQVTASAERLKDIATQLHLAPPTIADVMRGVDSRSTAPALSVDHARTHVLEAARAATAALVAFRTREGAALDALFREESDALTALFERIASLADAVIEERRTKLRDRVASLLPAEAPVDPTRLEQEIVLIAERSDIAEEILRARGHVAAIRETLQVAGPHGKRLDFLLQELIRETNTMASKSVSADLTHCVVDAKTRIERLREQAQNVE